jgi:protoheme IX farnesyltransferase
MNVAEHDAVAHANQDSGSAARFSRADLMALTKARLSLLVLVTTFFGFWLASNDGVDGWLLFHTLFGTALTAAASSVFNQIMEMDIDGRMARTADRPLPSRRLAPTVAFGIGWGLAALGIVHLGVKVNGAAAMLAALTLLIYIFIYTPMKQASSLNTLVGAVAGAIPPVIGWAAAGGGLGVEALFLFGILFFWQLPHFLAINWMYRGQYRDAGFVMWANKDEKGSLTALLALVFSVGIMAWMAVPYLFGFGNLVSLVGGALLGGVMVALAVRFGKTRTREDARRLFFYTLIYLPMVLTLLALTWKVRSS